MHYISKQYRNTASSQRGFSLITTLVLLVVVSVLGIAASQLVLVAERTSRYDRDSQIAFQAAEAALIDAEIDINGPNASASKRVDLFKPKNKVNFVPGCGTGTQRGMCATADVGEKPVWYQVNFTDDANSTAKTAKFGDFTGRDFAVGTTGIRPELAPRYIIEVIQDKTPAAAPSDVIYRITAMGFGPRKETNVVLQSIYKKI